MASMHQAATTVCYTAPSVTEEDVKKERLSLSEEDLAKIDGDLTGSEAMLRETPSMIERGLLEMQAALDAVPTEEKQSYERAQSECPQLVATETDPLIFLRSERFDAKRLSSMTQAGGALPESDMLYLQAGVAQLLPEDEMGRAVLLMSRGAADKVDASRGPHHLRCFFYAVHVASQDVNAQRHGFVFLVDQKRAQHGSFSRKRIRSFVDFLSSATPLRMRTMHFIYPAIRCEQKLNLPAILWILGRELRQRTLILSGCPNELVMDLQQERLLVGGIPVGLGGLYTLESHVQWLRRRHAHEQVHGGAGPTPALLMPSCEG